MNIGELLNKHLCGRTSDGSEAFSRDSNYDQKAVRITIFQTATNGKYSTHFQSFERNGVTPGANRILASEGKLEVHRDERYIKKH